MHMQDSSSDTLSPAPTGLADPGKPQTASLPHASHEGFEKDIEKSDSNSEENDEVVQDGEDSRQAHEQESDLVGWDGPNDPANPQVSYEEASTRQLC